jgi:hypothetical protein
MDSYKTLSTAELRKKLRGYGYRGYNSMSKDELINSAFIADTEQTLYKKFKPTPIDFSKYNTNRCNAHRYQRFVPDTDKLMLAITLFSGLFPEIDFTNDDIAEYRWVAIYNKNNQEDIYIHTLLKLKPSKGSYYVYIDIHFGEGDKIDFKIAKDKDHTTIVNTVLTNEQYYWYRHSTELMYQILAKRDTHERRGSGYSKYVNELSYLLYKIQKEQNIRIINLQSEFNNSFDYMKNFNKIFWIHMNLGTNDKNYIFYLSGDNVYTLIKFKYNMYKVEDIPYGEMKMLKVYVSKNYSDIINKVLLTKEYEAYMNETNEMKEF